MNLIQHVADRGRLRRSSGNPRRNRRGDAGRTGRLSAASCDEGAGSSLTSTKTRLTFVSNLPSTSRRPALKTCLKRIPMRLFTVPHRNSRCRSLKIPEPFLRKFARRTKSYSDSDRNPDRDSGKDSDFFHRTARISKRFRFFRVDGFDTVDGIKPAELRSNRRSFVMGFLRSP